MNHLPINTFCCLETKSHLDHSHLHHPAPYLHDPEYECGVLEVVLEGEVDLSDVLRGLGVVDVHVHQRDGAVLQKRHLGHRKTTTVSARYERTAGRRYIEGVRVSV